jgi:L-cystine uptake protein TcyP (sodium:dicarboxylate symporter family)
LNPAVLSTSLAWIFILINLIMLASAGIAGYIGGKLVFKD